MDPTHELIVFPLLAEEEGTELELEALYRRYCVRLKHALFVSALCVTLLCCFVLLCTVCIQHSHVSWQYSFSISVFKIFDQLLCHDVVADPQVRMVEKSIDIILYHYATVSLSYFLHCQFRLIHCMICNYVYSCADWLGSPLKIQ